MRSRLLFSVPALCFVIAAAPSARADCNLAVERLRRQAAQIADQAGHPHFIELVRAAERQMMEGDEEACQQAVEAANKADDASAEHAPIPAALPPVPPAVSPPAPVPAQRDPGPAPQLHGTVIDSSSRVGLFAGRDGTLVQVREGEPIGGFTVQAIRPGEADVIGAGVLRTVRVGVGGDAPTQVGEASPPDLAHVQGSDQHRE